MMINILRNNMAEFQYFFMNCDLRSSEHAAISQVYNSYLQAKENRDKKKQTKHQFPCVWLLFNEEGLRVAPPPSVSLIGTDPAASAETLRARRSRTRSAVLLKVCWTTETTGKQTNKEKKPKQNNNNPRTCH